MIDVSICIATYNKANALANTLQSICNQETDYRCEVIVADDGSPNNETRDVCGNYDIQYIRIERKEGYRNPSIARNVAYKAAKGRVIIAQSDDVLHATPNSINRLISLLREGEFVIATVINVDAQLHEKMDIMYNGGKCIAYYTGPKRKRPLFFLGALWRKDLYAVGGNDEEFIFPGREDVWFADCLIRGLHLTPVYTDEVIGYHQNHTRRIAHRDIAKSVRVYYVKHRLALRGLHPWTAKTGAWQL